MPFTYVTGPLVLFKGDALAPRVLNFGTTLEATTMRVFSNRAGSPTVADSGSVKIPSRGTTAMSYTLTDADECWVEIETTSETLIPTCYVARPAVSGGFETLTLYKPGDFAVFDPTGKRLW